jgi:hypothetical protein
MKVFGIGMPRTGTTSLTAALEILGDRAVRVGDRPHHCLEIQASGPLVAGSEVHLYLARRGPVAREHRTALCQALHGR